MMTPFRIIFLLFILAFLTDSSIAYSQSQVASDPLSAALIRAVERGDLPTVKSLLARGADKEARDEYKRSALACAAEKGHDRIVAFLLQKGANIHALDNAKRPPLFWAEKSVIVRMLLDKGADANARDYITGDGRTVLQMAAHRG